MAPSVSLLMGLFVAFLLIALYSGVFLLMTRPIRPPYYDNVPSYNSSNRGLHKSQSEASSIISKSGKFSSSISGAVITIENGIITNISKD